VALIGAPAAENAPVRSTAILSGAALVAASACTRFGVFDVGMRSAHDPKYTVVPQRPRIETARATGQ